MLINAQQIRHLQMVFLKNLEDRDEQMAELTAPVEIPQF